MKNKLGGLTTHWGSGPPIEEVKGGATTQLHFGGLRPPQIWLILLSGGMHESLL